MSLPTHIKAMHVYSTVKAKTKMVCHQLHLLTLIHGCHLRHDHRSCLYVMTVCIPECDGMCLLSMIILCVAFVFFDYMCCLCIIVLMFHYFFFHLQDSRCTLFIPVGKLNYTSSLTWINITVTTIHFHLLTLFNNLLLFTVQLNIYLI